MRPSRRGASGWQPLSIMGWAIVLAMSLLLLLAPVSVDATSGTKQTTLGFQAGWTKVRLSHMPLSFLTDHTHPRMKRAPTVSYPMALLRGTYRRSTEETPHILKILKILKA